MNAKSIEKLVTAWKAVHIVFKPIETKLKAMRSAVAAALIAAKLDHIVTKVGTISLQTITTTDWEGFARKHIAAAVIEAELVNFQKKSAPFVVASRDWTTEAKHSKPAKAA